MQGVIVQGVIWPTNLKAQASTAPASLWCTSPGYRLCSVEFVPKDQTFHSLKDSDLRGGSVNDKGQLIIEIGHCFHQKELVVPSERVKPNVMNLSPSDLLVSLCKTAIEYPLLAFGHWK